MVAADYAVYLPLAEALADAAGAVIRPYFRTRTPIDIKTDHSPVTLADREAETCMRELLGERVPEHGIVGEEFGSERSDAEYVWVLDPIDGTKAFLSGQPTFGTLIALLYGGVPVLGVIDQAVSRERWVGVQGKGTRFNGAAAGTRPCERLAEATLYATSPDMFKGPDAPRFAQLGSEANLTRYGLDCYAYGLLASGFVDLVVEASLASYDFCALVPVIEGAGGSMTDWQGQPLRLQSDGRVVAAGDARVQSEALRILASPG
ncbi:MAG: histidinol-phosphatase [Dehalococcoidia bacterium]